MPPASQAESRGGKTKPSVSLLLAKAISLSARGSLKCHQGSVGIGAESETRADENAVEHVHNPGHFRVDGALFPLGVLAECACTLSSLIVFLADEEPAGPAGRLNLVPIRWSRTCSPKGRTVPAIYGTRPLKQ